MTAAEQHNCNYFSEVIVIVRDGSCFPCGEFLERQTPLDCKGSVQSQEIIRLLDTNPVGHIECCFSFISHCDIWELDLVWALLEGLPQDNCKIFYIFWDLNPIVQVRMWVWYVYSLADCFLLEEDTNSLQPFGSVHTLKNVTPILSIIFCY